MNETPKITYQDLENIVKKGLEEKGIKAIKVAVNHITRFLTNITANKKKGIVKLQLTIDDDVLVNKGDIRKWRGQLMLLWIEFEEKKEFNYI